MIMPRLHGRLKGFSGGGILAFSKGSQKDFYRGENGEISFFLSKLTKTTFFAKNVIGYCQM